MPDENQNQTGARDDDEKEFQDIPPGEPAVLPEVEIDETKEPPLKPLPPVVETQKKFAPKRKFQQPQPPVRAPKPSIDELAKSVAADHPAFQNAAPIARDEKTSASSGRPQPSIKKEEAPAASKPAKKEEAPTLKKSSEKPKSIKKPLDAAGIEALRQQVLAKTKKEAPAPTLQKETTSEKPAAPPVKKESDDNKPAEAPVKKEITSNKSTADSFQNKTDGGKTTLPSVKNESSIGQTTNDFTKKEEITRKSSSTSFKFDNDAKESDEQTVKKEEAVSKALANSFKNEESIPSKPNDCKEEIKPTKDLDSAAIGRVREQLQNNSKVKSKNEKVRENLVEDSEIENRGNSQSEDLKQDKEKKEDADSHLSENLAAKTLLPFNESQEKNSIDGKTAADSKQPKESAASPPQPAAKQAEEFDKPEADNQLLAAAKQTAGEFEFFEPKPTERAAEKATGNLLQHWIRQAKNAWLKHLAKNAAAAGEDGQEVPSAKKVAKASATRDAELRQLEEARKLYESGLATVRDLISPSSMLIEKNHLETSGMFSQTFFVFAYPRFLDVNWLESIINSAMTMDLSFFIYPIDSAGILKQLRNKSAQVSASLSINAEKGKVRDPALETQYQNIEELRDRLTRSEEKFFQVGVYLTIYAEKEEKLIQLSKQVESALGAQLIFTKRCDLRHEQGFNSSLPQATDELGSLENLNTGPLSTAFPFVSNELSDDRGILYGVNRHNDTLIIFDRFSLENANSVVLATSGAGKSYAVKLEVLRSLMLGADVIVIDPEHEYEDLCAAVGGTYLEVSLASNQRINPFDLPRPFAGQEEEPGRALRQNIITLTGLLRLMLGEMNADEEATLDQALLDTYALKGITLDDPKPHEKEPPLLGDLVDVLDSMTGGEELAKRLSRFTTGSFAGLFNQPTNVDLGKGMIVFSIRDLDDELRPLAMFVILDFIWTLVRSEFRKRLLVIDEAWTMMQYPDSAKFLAGLVRRARKYFLGVTTITQNVHDFLGSDHGRTVIANSALQLLMKQSPAAVDQVAEVFHLTEGEKYTLLNSGRGQGIFFAGLQHVAIEIIASYGEHQLITTNPTEIAAREAGEEKEKKES
jgi:hypothetical protein